jgi:hypothetical protein
MKAIKEWVFAVIEYKNKIYSVDMKCPTLPKCGDV